MPRLIRRGVPRVSQQSPSCSPRDDPETGPQPEVPPWTRPVGSIPFASECPGVSRHAATRGHPPYTTEGGVPGAHRDRCGCPGTRIVDPRAARTRAPPVPAPGGHVCPGRLTRGNHPPAAGPPSPDAAAEVAEEVADEFAPAPPGHDRCARSAGHRMTATPHPAGRRPRRASNEGRRAAKSRRAAHQSGARQLEADAKTRA